jgi:hypothetical protein
LLLFLLSTVENW